jgi:hypothetical protein
VLTTVASLLMLMLIACACLQHFFHIVDKVMMPICGTDIMCNRRFLVQGSTKGN